MTTIITELCNASKEHHTDIYEPARENEDTLVLSSDTPRQLYRMIPMVPPLFRKTLAHMINHPDVIETQITPNERITLLYLYTSISMAMIHPSKQTFEERVESFRDEPSWKLTSHLSAESMALWGFFRKSPIDKQHTCCFACGCVLSDWVMDDNPFLGHSQFRPQCQWILLISLFERIFQSMRIQNSSIPVFVFPVKASSLSSSNYEMPIDVIKSRLKQVCNLYQAANLSIQSLAEIGGQSVGICRDIFGYSIHDIFFALCRKMFRYFNTQKTKATIEKEANIEIRHLYATAQSLVADILLHIDLNGTLHEIFPFQGGVPFILCVKDQLEEKMEINSGANKISDLSRSEPVTSQPVPPAEPVRPPPEASNSSKSSNEPSTSSCAAEVSREPSSTGSSAKAKQPIAVSRGVTAMALGGGSQDKKNQISESSKKALANRICVKCVRRPAVYLCVPCKHLAICENCKATKITACPACRMDVTDILRVFT